MQVEARIVKVDHLQRLTSLGNIEAVARVQYWAGPHGPFFVELPEADFNPTNVQNAMRRTVETLNALPIAEK